MNSEDWVAYKQRKRISHVLEMEKSKIKALADLGSSEDCVLIEGCLLTGSSYGRRDEGAIWGLFYKDTNPIHDGSGLMT